MPYRKIIALVIGGLLAGHAQAQDEGAVVKKERIERDNGIFVGGGLSILGGDNLGDYSNGLNFEAGYVKRLNRVVSIGGSVSYLKFAYDPEVTAGSEGISNIYLDPSFNYGYSLALTGGDVSIISVAANLKFNFVPVKDNSVLSVYAFAKPFIATTSVSTLSGYATYYYYDAGIDDYVPDPVGANSPYPPYDANIGNGDVTLTYPEGKSVITGGVFLGPGIELNPAKPISIFLQASFGYTFPLTVVSTKSYSNDVSVLLDPNDFPFQSLGFTSINFSAGISFNLD
jgi:hypothetical protein